MRPYSLVVAAALVAALAACSSSNTANTTSPSSVGTGATGTGGTDGSCTPTVVASEADTIGNRGSVTVPFTTSGVGRLDVSVDWTNPATNVGAFVVAAGSCEAAQFAAQSCTFLAQSGDGKPRLLSIPDLPAGNYELLIENFNGYPDEATATSVVLSTGTSCPAVPAPTPSPSPGASRH